MWMNYFNIKFKNENKDYNYFNILRQFQIDKTGEKINTKTKLNIKVRFIFFYIGFIVYRY